MSDRDSTAEKMAIAAHLYITFRRRLNRVIDVEWLVRNEEYAGEIISMARRLGLQELSSYINRLEELVFGKPDPVPVQPVMKVEDEDLTEEDIDSADVKQYIGALR